MQPHESRRPVLQCPFTGRSIAGPESGAFEYPELAGVRVVLPAAATVLASAYLGVAADRDRFEAEGDEPPVLAAASPARTAQRFAAMRNAERVNLELLECVCVSIAAYLGEERDLDRGLASLLALQLPGWSPAALLPYFHQDWAGTGSFPETAARIFELARRFGADSGSLAVLGCGAGGLVARLAPAFDHVIGVDLSCLGLLLARRLLDGERLTFAVQGENSALSDFPIVSVTGASPPPRNVSLVAAQAAELPFADGSLSCVVTQYLLDVVPDVAHIAQEIHRVLAPEGLWINHGCPFRLARDPVGLRQRTEPDMPAFLEGSGFRHLESCSLAHDHLNLSSVTPHAVLRRHAVLMFAGRKSTPLLADPTASAFRRALGGDPQGLDALVPRVRASERVVHMLGAELRGGRSDAASLFAVGRQVLRGFGGQAAAPEALHGLLNACLRRFDGSRSAREAFQEIHAESCGLMDARDFALSLRLMRNLGWVEVAGACP